MQTKQILLGAIFIVVFVLLGAFREMSFLNLNEQIFFMQGGTEEYRVLESYRFLADFSLPNLIKAKWIGTLAFAFLFLLLSMWALDLVFGRSGLRRWLLTMYAGAIVVAGLSYLGGNMLGNEDLGYTIARAIMGGLQSPFPLMLMIPVLLSSSR